VGAIVVSLLLNIGLFWLGFRLATASVVTWKELFLGAVLAAIVWQDIDMRIAADPTKESAQQDPRGTGGLGPADLEHRVIA
jgi:hypothetical protein